MENSYEKDAIKKLKFRIALRSECEKDTDMRASARESSKRDFGFFADNFLWTYNPKKRPANLPFILYPRQREYAIWMDNLIHDKEDGFVDKARDVGATYTTMCFLLWKWMFDEGFAAHVGSRKEELVDKKGSVGSLFHKLDYNIQRLPLWMLPKDFIFPRHRNRMALLNPENGNTITGESSNINYGRGDRKTINFLDELGFWEDPRPAWESCGDTTNTRLCVTTPPQAGQNSFVYKLKTGRSGRVQVFEFDYNDVPEKDQAWFAQKREKVSAEELQRETLRSYLGSAEGLVYRSEFESNVKKNPVLDYDSKLPLYVSWDFGIDSTAITWWQKDLQSGKVYWIDAYSNSNKVIDFYFPFVGIPIESGKFKYDQKDLEMIARHATWGTRATHFGDPDVEKRSLVMANRQGEPIKTVEVLREVGIYVQSKHYPGFSKIKAVTELMFRRLEVNEIRCEYAIECLCGARYPRKKENSNSTGENRKPVHDQTSHLRTSVEYFAFNEPPTFRKTSGVRLVKRVG